MAMDDIVDDVNDRKGSKINTNMSFVFDLSHCCQQKSKNKKSSLSATYALDCATINYEFGK